MQRRRLDQILSRYGYCSRSEVKALIRAGRVAAVDGITPVSPWDKVLPESVRVDGEPIEHPDGILALLHKPAGYVCSRDRAEGPSVYDLLPARWLRRHPPLTSVGRLDKDTTGVLLLTDIGSLVQRWSSPRHKITKVYEATVDKELNACLIEMFASGELTLERESSPCLPAKLELLSARTARLHLTEGRYHQVKRMFASQGYRVEQLHRSRFGEFDLGDLALGQWRLIPIESYL